MKKLFFVLVLLSSEINVKAQASANKNRLSLSVGVGLNYTALKNEIISPLIFSNVGVPVQLTLRGEGSSSKNYVQIFFQSQTLTSPFNRPIEEIGGHYLYGHLRKVKTWKNARFWVGGELQTQVVNRNMPTSINSNFLVFLNTLNLTGQLEYELERHRFEGQITLTALGYNIRPSNNFNVRATEGTFISFLGSGELETLPKYVSGSLRLSYLPPSTAKHFRWQIDYVGAYSGFNDLRYFGVLQHQLISNLTYQF